MLRIVEATAADVRALAERILPSDAADLVASGLTVEQCMDGVQAQALHNGDDLVCLFGAVEIPERAGFGVPWMLCTMALDAVPRRPMAQLSRQVMAGWQGRFTRMENYVWRHNARAIAYLTWLGFTVESAPVGPGGEFHRFTWGEGDV